MKKYSKINYFILMIFAFHFVCSAKLTPLSHIEKVGCIDNKAEHIGIILSDNYWEALYSYDCGKTWAVTQESSLLKKMTPLPSSGLIRYMFIGKRILICSKDSGKSWNDISPWIFLKQKDREDSQKDRDLYNKRYGNRIPQRSLSSWFISFVASAFFVMILSIIFIKVKNNIAVTAFLLSSAAYTIMGITIYFSVQNIINYLLYEQWQIGNLSGTGGEVLIPHWQFGAAIHILANPYYTPLLCLMIFPVTPLFFEICKSITNKSQKKYMLYVGFTLTVFFIVFTVAALLIGRSWGYCFAPSN